MKTLADNETIGKDVSQFVTFSLNNEDYAVNILSVQEINRINEITPVPNSPDYVEGVINLRGRVIPLINLRKKFGFEAIPIDETSRVIIMEIQGVINGLIVDSVSEVITIPPEVIESTPPMASATNQKFISGLAKLDDRLLILLDTDKLLDEAV